MAKLFGVPLFANESHPTPFHVDENSTVGVLQTQLALGAAQNMCRKWLTDSEGRALGCNQYPMLLDGAEVSMEIRYNYYISKLLGPKGDYRQKVGYFGSHFDSFKSLQMNCTELDVQSSGHYDLVVIDNFCQLTEMSPVGDEVVALLLQNLSYKLALVSVSLEMSGGAMKDLLLNHAGFEIYHFDLTNHFDFMMAVRSYGSKIVSKYVCGKIVAVMEYYTYQCKQGSWLDSKSYLGFLGDRGRYNIYIERKQNGRRMIYLFSLSVRST